MLLAGFDFSGLSQVIEHLPRLLAELAAIYFAVRQGVKHGNGG